MTDLKALLPLLLLAAACSRASEPAVTEQKIDWPTKPPVSSGTSVVIKGIPPVSPDTAKIMSTPLLEGTEKLRPVDEAPSDPSLLKFRDTLKQAVREKNFDAVLAMVDPKIKTNFGGGGGTADFRRQWKNGAPDSPFWHELDEVLAHGGSFDKSSGSKRFVAPYSYSRWPDSADSFENVVAVCPAILVLEKPADSAKPIARLEGDILPIGPDDPMRKGERESKWRQVSLPGKGPGWVEKRCMRSPIDYRAAFEQRAGTWKMIFFVSGD